MSRKIIVFDMDKTIGDFDLISFIYNELRHHTSISRVLDVFFECFRPHIFNIFTMLHEYKLSGVIEQVVLYTNNTGGVVWPKMIIDYIHYRLNFILFDHFITALYVNKGDIPDVRRTSIEKTYTDLQYILKLDSFTSVIFVDDAYHEKMLHSNVKYIQIAPYNYSINNHTILNKIKYIYPDWNICLPPQQWNNTHIYNDNISKKLFDTLTRFITA